MAQPAEGDTAPLPAPLPEPNQASALEEVRDRADTVLTRTNHGRPGRAVGRRELKGPRGRVAIVDGCRTPFTKSGTAFRDMDVLDLAGVAAAELVTRSGLDPKEIELAIFGTVLPALYAPNLGREVVFRCSLPEWIPGSGVSLACASSNLAITSAAEAILVGQADVVLAGGAEALSKVPIRFSDAAAQRLMELSRAKSLPQKAGVLAKLRPKDLAPVPPAIAEYTTGMTMGQAAEKMAKENDISRRAQDEIALMSHQRASAATREGRFAEQVVPTFPPPTYGESVLVDNGVRHDSSFDKLAQLPPVFDKRYGTITAGNASPITDGGSAVLVMSEEKAKALGYQPLGYVRSWAYASLDPGTQLLQGPAYAAPVALDAAGVTLQDLDLVDMHEAFAAQILSNLKAFNSKKFAADELGRSAPLGAVDFDKLNVNGGSIAIGHPFGATGARVTMQLLYELRRRGGNLGLLTVCAAGGVGFAMVVERE
ncbi:MAG TPA: acetyl-CoA C-acyltransferase FadI [Thermoanaerobaculia bacterium]|jgi:acetyl-CoA acyltransferase|nr:acetyl-CoA C-acyltransferase FadI [Thermoanaerobaculia bacterium]